MALKDKSLLLYGPAINSSNMNLDFLNAPGGSQLHAIIPSSYYTVGTLAQAIQLAMNQADPTNTYSVTVNRTVSSNLQNRITITTNGTFLSLLFNTGTFASTSIGPTINFGSSDLTGSTTYTNTASTGTALTTSFYGFNYTPPQAYQKNTGDVTVSASGVKEGISWSIQQFIQVQFKYEPQANVLAYWSPFIQWAIVSKPFDFTPEIMNPTTVYPVTLETQQADGKGLGFLMKEMLPDFPFVFDTGAMEFRVIGLF